MRDAVIRQLHLLREVPTYPRLIGTAELQSRLAAAGFPTSQRTVQRDLVNLSRIFPLIADDAKPQGWSWRLGAGKAAALGPLHDVTSERPE